MINTIFVIVVFILYHNSQWSLGHGIIVRFALYALRHYYQYDKYIKYNICDREIFRYLKFLSQWSKWRFVLVLRHFGENTLRFHHFITYAIVTILPHGIYTGANMYDDKGFWGSSFPSQQADCVIALIFLENPFSSPYGYCYVAQGGVSKTLMSS